MKIDVTALSNDFTVSIINATTGGDGATNMVSAVLDDTNVNWTGFSSINGGKISGNLTGDLFLRESSGGTGGDITGNFSIGGDVSGTIDVDLISANLTITGDLSGDLTVRSKIDNGDIIITGDVTSTSTIDIADMATAGTELAPFISINGDLDGDLVLRSGIGSHIIVSVIGELSATGSIDLKSGGIAGQLSINKGGAGTILNGGAVTGAESQTVILSCAGLAFSFSGQATFSSVSSVGNIVTEVGHISGRITVTGDMDGEISTRVGNLTSTSEIIVNGDVGGQITTSAGSDGGLTADGDIVIGELTGSIEITGSVSGDIEVKTDVGSFGFIQVDERLGRGRILVSGLCDGDITIGENTGSVSLIHLLAGLSSNGNITVNNSAGAFDAGGDILIGPVATPIVLDPITFDGCIQVLDDGAGSGGDLDGDITVVGCHATAADLGITIDGATNGSVFITQTGCANQVSYSACP